MPAEAAFAEFGLSATTKPEDAVEALRGHGRDLLIRLSGVFEKLLEIDPNSTLAQTWLRRLRPDGAGSDAQQKREP